jgi:hypothetical protein
MIDKVQKPSDFKQRNSSDYKIGDFLDTVDVLFLKCNISETEFCLCFHVKFYFVGSNQ